MMVAVDMCIHTHGQSSGSVKRIRRSGLRARWAANACSSASLISALRKNSMVETPRRTTLFYKRLRQIPPPPVLPPGCPGYLTCSATVPGYEELKVEIVQPPSCTPTLCGYPALTADRSPSRCRNPVLTQRVSGRKTNRLWTPSSSPQIEHTASLPATRRMCLLWAVCQGLTACKALNHSELWAFNRAV